MLMIDGRIVTEEEFDKRVSFVVEDEWTEMDEIIINMFKFVSPDFYDEFLDLLVDFRGETINETLDDVNKILCDTDIDYVNFYMCEHGLVNAIVD